MSTSCVPAFHVAGASVVLNLISVSDNTCYAPDAPIANGFDGSDVNVEPVQLRYHCYGEAWSIIEQIFGLSLRYLTYGISMPKV